MDQARQQRIEELRASAARIRTFAERADDGRARREEMRRADELEAEARRLEHEPVAAEDLRQRHYKLLQVGKRALGMDEDSYRTLLARHGAKAVDGRVSARTMHIGGLIAAVGEMRRKGFQPQAKAGSASTVVDWRAARIKKITALWCALADAGVVKSRAEASMVKWCAGITRKPRLQWASSADLNRCIEGLKEWARRERVKIDD